MFQIHTFTVRAFEVKLTKSIKKNVMIDAFNWFVGPLSVDRYAEIDDEVDVEQCSDSEVKLNNTKRVSQASLVSPPSDDERLTPEQIPVNEEQNHFIAIS